MKIEIRKFNSTIYIENDKYPTGVTSTGNSSFPDIGVEYDFLMWDSLVIASRYYNQDGIVYPLSEEQNAQMQTLVTNWHQPVGQEGNPTLEQRKMLQKSKLIQAFNLEIESLTSMAQYHEMASWRKQEDEARAYTADNTVATPFIDAQVATRQLETKDELVAKIIANADAYQVTYAGLLGKYQNLSNAISIATTATEVEAIVW